MTDPQELLKSEAIPLPAEIVKNLPQPEPEPPPNSDEEPEED
jgi:hypothetical protein